MRHFLFLVLLAIYGTASSQYVLPAYTVQKDSASHMTVFHPGISDRALIVSAARSDTFTMISPDIKIANGIVDHKNLTGEMLVREYFADSVLIGYIEYDGQYFLRERYLYTNGFIFLDKRYEK